jgi:hypothetical protein
MRGISSDPRVRTWVAERRADGWKRDRIVAASKAGTDGWPIPGESMSNGTFSIIKAALEAAKGEPLEPPTRPARRAGRRQRELQQALKDAEQGGKRNKLIRQQMALQKATGLLEVMDVSDIDFDDRGVVGDTMRRIHDDLAEHQIWLDYQFEQVRARMDDAVKLATIQALREGTAGRTEAEIATMERLAERMQRKLDARLARRSNGSQ